MAEISGLVRSCPYGEISGFSNNYVSCKYKTSTRELTVTNGLKFEASELDPPTLTFEVGYWRNPRSIQESDMFNVTIYDADDNGLFYFNSSEGPTIKMSGFAEPNQIEYARSSYENGVMVNYTWQIKGANYLEAGDIIKITMPSPVRFTDDTLCYGTSYWMEGPLNCTFSGDLQTVYAEVVVGRVIIPEETGVGRLLEANQRRQLQNNIIPANAIFNLLFTSITSPTSLRPADGSIEYEVLTADGYTIEAQSTGLDVVNT